MNDSIRKQMSRDLAAMMYGLGDDRNPYTETMEAMTDLVMEYVSEVTVAACRVSAGNEVSVESVAYVVRQSSSKCSRIRTLMDASQDLRTARRAFHVER